MIKSKATLEKGEGISKVLSLTSLGNLYEAQPSEVANAALPSSLIGAMASTYQLEQSSNPAFDVRNRGAAELYQSRMGGYAFLVKSGSVYAAKLNPGSWDSFADGTPIGNASRFETMIHVPDCHFKADGTVMNFGGITPIDGGKAFRSPHWVGAYKMYVDASGIGHSRPDVAPSHSKTMSAFWSCAQKLGSEFGLANYGFHCLINALYQARYGNLDSQATIGAGFQTSSWEAARDVPMGLLRSLGDGSGKVYYTDATIGDQYPVKLFGFEDLWGKLWEFRPGIRFSYDANTGIRTATVYDGNVVSNTASGRTFTCLASANGEYVKKMQLGEWWDMIAQATGAGSTTYYCDGYWAATGGELLFVGGNAHYGSHCGLSCANSISGFSASWTNIGARLAFFGEPELVSGAEIVSLAGA